MEKELIDKITNKHNKLRSILSKYGDEFGDAILDEICDLFDYPNTVDNTQGKQNGKTKSRR